MANTVELEIKRRRRGPREGGPGVVRRCAVYVADKPQCEVKLIRTLPPRAGDPTGQHAETLNNRIGQRDANEEPLHSVTS